MVEPLKLLTFPESATVLLVIVPTDTFTFGVNGAADTVACKLAPAELTALTLNVCVPLDNPVKTCVRFVEFWAGVQAPLLSATSYLVIAAPPLVAGIPQLRLTSPTLDTALRFRGGVGTVADVLGEIRLL